MKNSKLVVLVILSIILSTIFINGMIEGTSSTFSSTTACCSITVVETGTHSATVIYSSNIPDESFDMYVSVEYPDTDYTTEQQLDLEIGYAIDQMQELCYHNH